MLLKRKIDDHSFSIFFFFKKFRLYKKNKTMDLDDWRSPETPRLTLDKDVTMGPVPGTFEVIFLDVDSNGKSIVTNKSETYVLTEKQLSLSGYFRSYISFKENQMENDPTGKEEPIVVDFQVKALKELKKFHIAGHIVNYLKIRNGDAFHYPAKPLVAPKGSINIDILKSIDDTKIKAWIEDIMNTDKSQFIGIVVLADYLAIDCLVHLASATIASLLAGVDPSKYATVFSPVLETKKRARSDVDSDAFLFSRSSSLVPITPVGTTFRTRSSSPSSLVPITPVGTTFRTRSSSPSSPPSSPVSNLTLRTPNAPKKEKKTTDSF
jgi:hypothetical protein